MNYVYHQLYSLCFTRNHWVLVIVDQPGNSVHVSKTDSTDVDMDTDGEQDTDKDNENEEQKLV